MLLGRTNVQEGTAISIEGQVGRTEPGVHPALAGGRVIGLARFGCALASRRHRVI
jgi:hypothetical protein